MLKKQNLLLILLCSLVLNSFAQQGDSKKKNWNLFARAGIGGSLVHNTIAPTLNGRGGVEFNGNAINLNVDYYYFFKQSPKIKTDMDIFLGLEYLMLTNGDTKDTENEKWWGFGASYCPIAESDYFLDHSFRIYSTYVMELVSFSTGLFYTDDELFPTVSVYFSI